MEKVKNLGNEMAGRLGIGEVEIGMDEEGASKVRDAGALGIEEGGRIYLDVESFDPDKREHRETLGHEIAHVYQLKKGGGVCSAKYVEKEAERTGKQIAEGADISKPMAILDVSSRAVKTITRDITGIKASEIDKILINKLEWIQPQSRENIEGLVRFCYNILIILDKMIKSEEHKYKNRGGRSYHSKDRSDRNRMVNKVLYRLCNNPSYLQLLEGGFITLEPNKHINPLTGEEIYQPTTHAGDLRFAIVGATTVLYIDLVMTDPSELEDCICKQRLINIKRLTIPSLIAIAVLLRLIDNPESLKKKIKEMEKYAMKKTLLSVFTGGLIDPLINGAIPIDLKNLDKPINPKAYKDTYTLITNNGKPIVFEGLGYTYTLKGFMVGSTVKLLVQIIKHIQTDEMIEDVQSKIKQLYGELKRLENDPRRDVERLCKKNSGGLVF